MSTNERSTNHLTSADHNYLSDAKSLYKRTPITQISASTNAKDDDSKTLSSQKSLHSNRDNSTIGGQIRFDSQQTSISNTYTHETDNPYDMGILSRAMVSRPVEVAPSEDRNAANITNGMHNKSKVQQYSSLDSINKAERSSSAKAVEISIRSLTAFKQDETLLAVMKSKSQETPNFGFKTTSAKHIANLSLNHVWPKVSNATEPPQNSQIAPFTNTSTTKNNYKRSPIQDKQRSDRNSKRGESAADRDELLNLSIMEADSDENDKKNTNVKKDVDSVGENIFNDLAGLHKDLVMMKNAILSRGKVSLTSVKIGDDVDNEPKSENFISSIINPPSPTPQKGILSNREYSSPTRASPKTVKFHIKGTDDDDDYYEPDLIDNKDVKNQFIKRKLPQNENAGDQKQLKTEALNKEIYKNGLQDPSNKGQNGYSQSLSERGLLKMDQIKGPYETVKQTKESQRRDENQEVLFTQNKKNEATHEKQSTENPILPGCKDDKETTVVPLGAPDNSRPKSPSSNNVIKKNIASIQKRTLEAIKKDSTALQTLNSPGRKADKTVVKKGSEKSQTAEKTSSKTGFNTSKPQSQQANLIKGGTLNVERARSSSVNKLDAPNQNGEKQNIKSSVTKLEVRKANSTNTKNKGVSTTETNLKVDLGQSQRILSKLKETVEVTKSKEDLRQMLSSNKKDASLRTTGDDFLKSTRNLDDNEKNKINQGTPQNSTKLKASYSDLASRRTSKDIPLTTSQIDPRTLKPESYYVRMKQNKYYAVERTPQKSNLLNTARSTPQSPTDRLGLNSARTAVRKESGLYSKTETPKKEVRNVTFSIDASKAGHINDNISKVKSTKASIGGTKDPEFDFTTKNPSIEMSKSMQLALGTKYAELLNQAEEVTRQLESLNKLVYNNSASKS